MPFLDEKTRGEIKKLLDDLDAPVQLVTFTQELECDSCHANRELIEELAAISDKLHCQVFDFVKDAEKASELGVDKVPATVVVGPSGSRVRFYGIPAGYEFATLIEDVMMMSAADSGLSAATREKLRAIAKPVHLQVLVTPTWPYCPRAVRLAHQMAIENEHITADMVELTEFPHLAQRYRVMGVPKTVINETDGIDGAVPEAVLLEAILASEER